VFQITFAQSNKIFKGQILSQSDSLPVCNAHIYMKNSSIGTISNQDGFFQLNIPEILTNDTMKISCIGFSNYNIHLKIGNGDMTIFLSSKTALLPEITVTTINAKEIIKKSISSFEKNYFQKEIINDIYYRETLKLDTNYVHYLEIAAEIIDKGFDNDYLERENYRDVFIKGKRMNLEKESTYNGQNGLFTIYWLNWAKGLLTKKALREYEFEYEGMTEYDDKPVIIISVKTENDTKSQLYISNDDYAIVLIKSSLNNERQSESKGKEKFWFLRLELYVDFRRVNNMWHINSISDYRKSMNKNRNITESHRIINIIGVSFDRRENSIHKINSETDLFAYPIPYNLDFWKTYNIPIATGEETRVRKLMEKEK